jgi:hypothetical protein
VKEGTMMSDRLIKTDELHVQGQAYPVKYFENETLRGTLRYSSEVLLGPADRIIVDGNSLTDVESKVVRLVPATIYSRLLAARAA